MKTTALILILTATLAFDTIVPGVVHAATRPLGSDIRKEEAAGSVREMSRSDLDRSMLSSGSYVSVVYMSEGGRRIASGEIVANEADHLVVQSVAIPWKKWKIVFSDIEVLAVHHKWREIDRWRRAKKKAVHRLEEPNSRVRIKAHSISNGWISGEFSRATVDTIRIHNETGPLLIAVSSIDKLEVSLGRHRNTLKGTSVGLFVGLGAAFLMYRHGERRYREFGGWEGFGWAWAAVLTLPTATLCGTLIGAKTKTERWIEVSPSRINLSVSPTRDKGLRAALSIDF